MVDVNAHTDALLRAAWSALEGDPDSLDRIEVTGDGAGLLPSTLPALPAMVAAVAASTLAASVLDAERRGRVPEPAHVDVEHVALAARSERYAREETGRPHANPFAPLSRFWRTADGWMRLHANYRWHRERALRVLGCEESDEGVADAVRTWRGEDLEDVLADAGGVGYAMRSTEEWHRHPQGRAVARLPLLEQAAGTVRGRAFRAGRLAEGVRVLDLTRVIAGPVATRTLAGWGADVLRLDSPDLPEIPAQAVDTLPGKRSALLDLASPAGRTRLETLLDEADVVVQGYRPGALARYGLSPDALASRHPHLTSVTLSAWGSTGPWAERRGFDSLVQCPTGIALREGADGEPGALPAQVLDHATGYVAAAAALLSLAGVARGEPPRSVRLSLAQTARWLTSRGTGERDEPRDLPVEPHLVTLSGPDGVARVVAPVGRVGDRQPQWRSTTRPGIDPAAFG